MREHPYVEGQAPEQGTYLPECLDEVISHENPIRFIRTFVLQLNLVGMGFVRSKPMGTGRQGYDPAVLLMLYIYGHLNRIWSSRMLERECRRNTYPLAINITVAGRVLAYILALFFV